MQFSRRVETPARPRRPRPSAARVRPRKSTPDYRDRLLVELRCWTSRNARGERRACGAHRTRRAPRPRAPSRRRLRARARSADQDTRKALFIPLVPRCGRGAPEFADIAPASAPAPFESRTPRQSSTRAGAAYRAALGRPTSYVKREEPGRDPCLHGTLEPAASSRYLPRPIPRGSDDHWRS